MPNYGVAQAGGVLTAIQPGDWYKLFDAETATAPQASVAFARAPSPSGADEGITFTISFATQPTAVVLIQGANVDSDAEYQTLFQSANLQTDKYTDRNRFAFYRAVVQSQSAGGAITVIAQR